MSSPLEVGQTGTQSNRNSVSQFGTLDNGVPVCQNDTPAFFARLLTSLEGDYQAAATIVVLLRRKADIAFVGASYRDLSARLGGLVPMRTIARAIDRLAELGLIERQMHPNTATELRINSEALRALLAQPLPSSAVLPGITPLDDALARIFGQPTPNTQAGDLSNGQN